MTLRNLPTSLAALLVVTSLAAAQTDRVRTDAGTQAGKVTEASVFVVKLEKGGRTLSLPVHQVQSIQFGGEPSRLTQARANALSGSYEKAIELLKQVRPSDAQSELVKQEIAFYRAYCVAKQAMLGQGSLKSAGSLLNGFASANRTSFHQLETQQMLGDLLSAMGNHSAAQTRYGVLAKAPWPAYKVRSAVLVGKSLQAQSKHAEAIQQFDRAATLGDDSPESAAQVRAASLGKAVSMSATGKVDEAVKMVRQAIDQAAPEEHALLAQAYNALGGCYTKAGDTKAALYAYLHVDLLYANSPNEHAEALYHLGPLLEEAGKPNDARDARGRLMQQYPGSTWAKQ